MSYAMIESLGWFGTLCTSDSALHGGLLAGLFTAGAVGSIVHCGPMCGVFILGQVSERVARLPATGLCEWQRVRSGVLLPYHLGRLTTYAGLGALAAGSAGALSQIAVFRGISALSLVIAAALFLAHGLGRILPHRARFNPAPRLWGRLIGRYAARIERGSTSGEYLLGLTLGFLPCGFLYAAIATAASSARPDIGAASLVAFGLGTTPALVIVGIAGQAAGRRWNRAVLAAAPVVMMLNAALLLTLAFQRLV